MNQWGQVAQPFSDTYPAFIDYAPFYGGGTPGSNFGGCIDIWAPGNAIYSTWGQGWFATKLYDENGNILYYVGGQPPECANMSCTSPPQSGWAWLSGTSMAAPHAAAVAAYLIDRYHLSTPGAVEQMMRSVAHTLPNGLKMVRNP